MAIAKLQSKFTLIFSNGEAICRVKIRPDSTAQTKSFPRLLTPRLYHTIVENPDQKLFALGGVCQQTQLVLNTIEVIDNKQLAWSKLALRLPLGGLYDMSAVCLPDGLLCFGGMDQYNNASAQCFKVWQNKINKCQQLPFKLQGQSHSVRTGNYDTVFTFSENSLLKYDVRSDRWEVDKTVGSVLKPLGACLISN